MPRPRDQIAEEDVSVVHRWVQAKCRDAAYTAWDQFPREHPTATRLQQWCDRHLDGTQWTQLQAVIRAARRDARQTRTVRLSTRAHTRLHDLAARARLTLSETIERYLSDVTVLPTPTDTPPTTAETPPTPHANRLATPDAGRATVVPRKPGVAFVTSKKGVCYLTITFGRHHCSLMRIRHDPLDAQDKREMHRLHPDIAFERKAAGAAASTLLLSKSVGISRVESVDSNGYVRLPVVPHPNRNELAEVLRRRVFISPEADRFEPIHRTIAEFLAAEDRSKRIVNGLPIDRVMALIGGVDRRPIASLRGLFAWVMCKLGHRAGDYVERDPLRSCDVRRRQRAATQRTVRTLGWSSGAS
jgi:hypothetical protein